MMDFQLYFMNSLYVCGIVFIACTITILIETTVEKFRLDKMKREAAKEALEKAQEELVEKLKNSKIGS